MFRVINYMFMVVLFCLGGCKAEQETNILKFGVSADYPPFEYHSNNEIVGFDIDLAKLVAKEMGKEAVFVDMQFSSIFPALTSDKIDLAISTIAITDERSIHFDFSVPYYHEQIVVVSKKDNSILTKNELDNKKIACQIGSVFEVWLKNNIKTAQITAMNDANQAIESLKAGHVDCAILDAVQAMMFSSKNPGLSYSLIDQAQNGYVLLLPKNSKLKQPVDQAILKLTSSGEIKKLEQKWIDQWKN